MIAELVVFRHPQGTTREHAQQGALAVVPAWQANPQLLRKHFLFHDDSSTVIRWTTPRLDTAGLSIT